MRENAFRCGAAFAALCLAGAAAAQTPTRTPTRTLTPTPTSTRVTKMTIAKVASAPVVQPGDTFHYDITVNNEGPALAIATHVDDVLPPEVVFLGCTPAPFFGSSCSGPPVGTSGGVSAFVGNVGPGGPGGSGLTTTIVVRVVASGGAINNRATVGFTGINTTSGLATNTVFIGAAPPPVPASSPRALGALILLLVAVGWIVSRRA